MPKHDPADLQEMVAMAEARRVHAHAVRTAAAAQAAHEEQQVREALAAQKVHEERMSDPLYVRGVIVRLELDLAEARRQLRRLEFTDATEADLFFGVTPAVFDDRIERARQRALRFYWRMKRLQHQREETPATPRHTSPRRATAAPEEMQTATASASCPQCAKLQTRIAQLEALWDDEEDAD